MFREGAPAWSSLLPAVSRTLQEPYRCWEKLRLIEAALFFQHEADGGGDGGSGTGTGGDGSGDGSGSGDTGSGASDSSGSSSDSTGPGDNGDPDADPSTTDNALSDPTNPAALTDPTNQTAVTAPLDFAAQQAFDAVANPFGGVPGYGSASGWRCRSRH
jgi:hypothetical protein